MTQTLNPPTSRAFTFPTNLLIGGQLCAGEGSPIAVGNPATEEQITSVATATLQQCDEAIAAARRTFDSGVWSDAPRERSRVMHRLADVLEARRDELVAVMVEEVGTPVTLARSNQVDRALIHLRWYADAASVDRTVPLPPDLRGALPSNGVVYHQPCGVVAAITAYNYPLMLFMSKGGAALAAGCTVVLLPSPQTPLSSLILAEATLAAGFPDGVLNVVVGDQAIGRRLCESPDVDRVSFTGSVRTGGLVAQQAVAGIKGVTLELGGKSAALVLPDLDPATVATPIHLRYSRNAGQGCASPTRILVHESRRDEFIAASVESYRGIRVGDPWQEETAVGPLISAQHRARVEGFVERAVAAGGEVVAGGGRPEMSRGWFMNPTLVSAPPDAEIAQNELFGPVAVLHTYADVDEAVAIANGTRFGLAAHVYGKDVREAIAVGRRMRAGTVGINGGGAFRPDAPFGGFKESGIGRELGEWGVREYLEPQHVQWPLR